MAPIHMLSSSGDEVLWTTHFTLFRGWSQTRSATIVALSEVARGMWVLLVLQHHLQIVFAHLWPQGMTQHWVQIALLDSRSRRLHPRHSEQLAQEPPSRMTLWGVVVDKLVNNYIFKVAVVVDKLEISKEPLVLLDPNLRNEGSFIWYQGDVAPL